MSRAAAGAVAVSNAARHALSTRSRARTPARALAPSGGPVAAAHARSRAARTRPRARAVSCTPQERPLGGSYRPPPRRSPAPAPAAAFLTLAPHARMHPKRFPIGRTGDRTAQPATGMSPPAGRRWLLPPPHTPAVSRHVRGSSTAPTPPRRPPGSRDIPPPAAACRRRPGGAVSRAPGREALTCLRAGPLRTHLGRVIRCGRAHECVRERAWSVDVLVQVPIFALLFPVAVL